METKTYMNDTQACCAHCKVVLKHKDYPDGTRSDYWECADGCGKMFWPDNSMEEATAVFSRETYDRMMKEQDETIARLQQELEEIRAVFQHGADDELWKPGTTLAQAVAGLKQKLRSSKT